MRKLAKTMVLGVLRNRRLRNSRNLFWWRGPPTNFGDLIGPYLFRKITHTEPFYKVPSSRSLSTVFVTVGSLGEWIRENSIIWGTGIIRKDTVFPRPTETTAVRGPLTRRRFLEMGYSCPKIFGDPGLLLPRFFSPAVETRFHVGLVPHYIHIDRVLELYDGDPEILVIDVRREVEAVVSDILSCSVIASSSLHGLLVSHAYGIPAYQLEFSESLAGDGTKFNDYFLSVGIEKAPSPLSMTTKMPGAELRAFAEERESPQIEHLLEPLLASCPFAGPKELS